MEMSSRMNEVEDVSPADGVPELAKELERMVDRYSSGRSNFVWEDEEAEDEDMSLLQFLAMVDRISAASASLSSSSSSSSTVIAFQEELDQIAFVLEKAMSLLEKHLSHLLHDDPKSKPPNKSFSFNSPSYLSSVPESPSPRPPQQDHHTQDPFDFSPQKISTLNKIATAMISAGYHIECYLVFASFRRTAFRTTLQTFGFGNTRMEDLCKMSWESLEAEIATWNQVVWHCTTVLFKSERKLYKSIFPDHPSISQNLFCDLARQVIVHLLNFAQCAVLTKWTTEKLFKFLDMYETLREDVIGGSYLESGAKELAYEAGTARDMIVEAIMAMFCDLKNSIKNDNERIPVPNGAVHPLTRYVMNYLKYACEYKDTLEEVFEQGERINEKEVNEVEDVEKRKNSGFAVQLMSIMDLLDANVERKSQLYRDDALRYFFLMNNGRYVVQKVKGCEELHELMGDNWCRRRQSGLRLYHKCYQRETWTKVLQCLKPEGLQQGTGNKVSKQLVKERFKCFNRMFEEIHKCQSCWMVSDQQLQSELRVSISSLVIPAYRSFVGRFKQHLESTRHIDKYIKYHPDDIELLIDDFFAGNAASMPRRRS
ncbi:Exocyst complex component [Vigna angularis]|uniref:Exocyst subunit Exo70 family protein n=2 Tax=Phaseolus angularis TaxID=3914 RepID=A0A8T0KST3_PHAAN|nr:Exocyst complex component [Vigna angularis]BAT93502.1 hypothetical protein VIGAN_08001100 [Vigna angularis var. angularis]